MDANIQRVFKQLKPAGSDGFEGLIASLLEALTGVHFNLAISGSQEGRDMSSRRAYGNVIAVECKRYGENTSFDERELLGEVAQVVQAIPDLDVWVLVTSRDIPSQLEEVLNRFTEQQGIKFISISSAGGSPSSLEVLCAHSPEIFIAYSKISSNSKPGEISNSLNRITTHPNFQQHLTSLRTEFLSPLVGYASWRAKQNKWFIRCLTSDREARANFGQPINVEDKNAMLITRRVAWQSMDKWLGTWKVSHDQMVILGEEGDGKTWATVSWLCNQIKTTEEFPGVIFLSSTDLNSYDVIKQLSDIISRRLFNLSEEQMEPRFRRWIRSPNEKNPRLILVLDGINERRTSEWWRVLLDKLSGEPWYSSTAIILTCRTLYWNRHFAPLRHFKFSALTLEPYDDNELSEALAYYGLNHGDIPDNVLTLVRKPRYFDLMIRHRKRISESGDVTVARLIYEDWRDRLERKQNIPLSDSDFQNLIRKLAQIHKGKTASLSEDDLAHTLSVVEDRGRILEEMRTSAILRPHGGKYKIDEKLLVYGLGLLLVDQLEQASADAVDFQEVISKWLEPHSDMDIKTNICEYAALHSLYLKDLPIYAKVALFQIWVESRNPSQDVEEAFLAYLPIDPNVYIALAEIVWSETANNPWAQEMLISSFLKWYSTENISPVLRSAFERWLGFVHINGFPLGRKPDDIEKIRLDISERLGRDIELGSLPFAGYSLTVIDDDGQLRLARAALAIISHLPRIDFIHAIALGCVAEAIMGSPDKYDLFAWIIRTSTMPLWNEIRSEAEHLLTFNTIVTQQAAYRLLSFEGSREAIVLRKTIVDNIFPIYPHIEQHKQDPCTSGFSWSLKDCYKCLDRKDQKLEWVVRQISSYCVDPNLPVPDHLKVQFSNLTEDINVNSMWILMGPTMDDHKFEMYEPVLMAYAPHSAAELIHSLLAEINTREGMAQRQMSIRLEEHYIILTAEEKEKIFQVWNELISGIGAWSDVEETTEMFLFKLVLKNLSGDDQLQALLRRPERSRDLTIYSNSFLQIENWDIVRNELMIEIGTKRISRLLWFISTFPKEIPLDILTSIAKLINHTESLIRFHALEITYHAENTELIAVVLNSGWKWSPSHCDFENHWGSLVLSEYGQDMPFVSVCTRIHPAYLGHAIFSRGNQENEIEFYVQSIHKLWLGLETRAPDLPIDTPNFTVDSTEANNVEHMGRLGVSKESFDRSVTWISHHASWGGTHSDDFDFNIFDNNSYINRQKSLLDILREAIAQQKAAGNFLFGHDFHHEELGKIDERYPDLVDEWIKAALKDTPQVNRYLRLSSSFYVALCISLLKKKEMEKALPLYWRLQDAGMRVKVVDYHTKMELIDLALFASPPTDRLRKAWSSKLEEANSDQKLLQVAVYAQHGEATNWFWTYINEGIRSTVPLIKARSIVLSGFFDDQKALDILDDILRNNGENTWITKLVEDSKHRWSRNIWAKHWYRLFLISDDDIVSWASFRLFLKCVDTRFWLWQNDFKTEIAQLQKNIQRLRFLQDSLENIWGAIEKNEKEMVEKFLGQKILKGEVWPWMSLV